MFRGPVQFSTASLADDARLRQWEAWNRRALVGLTCSTPDGSGLHAAEGNLSLPGLDLALVRAARHTATRGADVVESQPCEAGVVYLPLLGQSTVRDLRHTATVGRGRVLALNASRPFRREFPTHFTELVLKLPVDAPDAERWPTTSSPEVLSLHRSALLRVDLLWHGLTATFSDTTVMLTDSLEQVARQLLRSLTRPDAPPAVPGDRLAMSELLIDKKCRDSDLTLSKVSQTLGVSERQLSRAYAAAGTSFPREVKRRRLERAQTLLRTTSLPISEVARRSGFASASYFCRAFRDETDRTPGEHRAA